MYIYIYVHVYHRPINVDKECMQGRKTLEKGLTERGAGKDVEKDSGNDRARWRGPREKVQEGNKERGREVRRARASEMDNA